MTLLLCAVSGAWAADFVDTYGTLGTVTGTYIADGISKITLGENAKANSGIEATASDATLKFTVSTPDGFTIKTVRFKDSYVNEANISCNDATGTLATASHYTTLTASADKTSIEFSIPSTSGKKAKLTEFVITVSSSTTDDYELITPKSISSGTITYTSSLGDDKLVTAMAGVGGPSVGDSDLNFGNGKGFSITTKRPIKAVYCVWFQRAPIADNGWQGYSNAEATVVTGSYSATTNAWTASGEETQFVAFKSSEGSTHKLSSIHIFYYPEKAISTQEFNGVKKGASTLAETTDYTVAGTVITLTALHKSLSAPDDIKLINHVTYTDASTTDKDVTVSFDGTATAGYFVSDAAAIGATNYTVKVPVDVTPTLTLSADAGSIALKSFEVTGSTKVTVTGANLTGDTFTAPTVDGITITPASATITDGAFSQEFTITTTSTTGASTVIGFAHTGATTKNFTLTYSKTAQRTLAQADVTETTTWDWTKASNSDNKTIQLKSDGTTDPKKNTDFLLSNIAEITNDANFNSQALYVNLEFANRDQKFAQVNTIAFNTTKPGTVQVWFSNTGSREDTDANRRYLYVNSVNSGVYSLNTTATNTEAITVPAGKVVISAYTGVGDATMVRVPKIVFTANDAIEQDAIEVPCPGGLGTFYDGSNDLDFSSSSAQAYIVTAVTASAVTLTEVKKVPKGYGVIVKGASQGETVNVLTTTMTSDEIDAFEALGNKLHAGPWTVSSDGQYWALSKTDGKFHPLKAGVTIPAGKAYLPGSEVPAGANFLSLDFGEGSEATGIEMVESKKMVNNNVFYNLAGQQVAQPTKGLYIVNGKKVIIK